MRRIPSAVLLLFLSYAVSADAQWRSIGDVDSFKVAGGRTLHLFSSGAVVKLEVLSDELIRVRLAPHGVFAPDISEALVGSLPQGTVPSLEEHPDRITLRTPHAVIEIGRSPLRIQCLDREGTLLIADDSVRGMAWDGRAVRVWKTMPEDESYYGFGEKSGNLNKRSSHLTMWNSDIPAYTADTDPLYQSIPFFIALRGGKAHGVFFHTPYWSSFDMGKESRSAYSFGAEEGELDYYVIYGPDPKKVIENFSALVGRMPLPPMWSLGYQQCRWSYYPEERVRQLAATFREKKIPADVIYLDIDYMEGYRIFTWSKKNFPRPEKLIQDLAASGFKLAVILDPGIKQDTSYATYRSGIAGDHFLRYPDGRVFIGKVWPGECAFPDFSRPSTREWWGEELKPLVDAGIRGFWTDMNEPSVFDVPTKTVDLSVVHDDHGLRTSHAKNHNLYGLLMTRATREGVLKHRPAERPFVLTRASFAGGQRYSAAWTGDNVASWEHLQMVVPMCLNLGMSGQPFIGSDIGGFIRNPDGELYARWLQLGVFTPLMRTHTETGSADQEPWSYGPDFERINRATIELRYRLLPYLYGAMRTASETGIPVMRPMLLEHPRAREVVSMQDQFYVGDHLLVAPVLWPGKTERRLWLPEGRWYDFWEGTVSTGPAWITVPAPLERIPIMVKEGGVIPLGPVMQHVGEQPTDPLTIVVFPADSRAAQIYEDDGLSFEYQNGAYAQRTVSQRVGPDEHIIHVSALRGSYRPRRKTLILRLVGIDRRPAAVRTVLDGDPPSSVDREWTFDASAKSLTVIVPEDPRAWSLVISQ